MTLLEVFDLPPMTPNCIERRQSTVPTQALQMMNSDVMLEHSRYFSGRLIDEFGDHQEDLIDQLYFRAFSRHATAQEIKQALEGTAELEKQWRIHLENERHEAPKLPTARWRALADLCHALLSSAEFLYID